MEGLARTNNEKWDEERFMVSKCILTIKMVAALATSTWVPCENKGLTFSLPATLRWHAPDVANRMPISGEYRPGCRA